MTDRTSTGHSGHIESLGWSRFFANQLLAGEELLSPSRVDGVHRSRLTGLTEAGKVDIVLPPRHDTSDYAVGDWVLADPLTHLFYRRLDRKTLLQRRGEGKRSAQLIAANIDTLFIVASCNADFNIARLERYLALANDAKIQPIVVLTKVDLVDNASDFENEAASLQRGLIVVSLNPRSADAAITLAPWCGPESTVALVGSSGVGKSTLVNTLAASTWMPRQATGPVRDSDSKGRHVTTSRSLHLMRAGGCVIDTPGIRGLHLSDVMQGIDALFAEITELAPNCKFRDCTHSHEPGCAVLAAIAAGTVDPDRLVRWRKLQTESRGSRR